MNYLSLLFQIYASCSVDFYPTIRGTKLHVVIVDKGSQGNPSGFNLGAASAIASQILTGQPGVFDVRGGADVFEVTISKV